MCCEGWVVGWFGGCGVLCSMDIGCCVFVLYYGLFGFVVGLGFWFGLEVGSFFCLLWVTLFCFFFCCGCCLFLLAFFFFFLATVCFVGLIDCRECGVCFGFVFGFFCEVFRCGHWFCVLCWGFLFVCVVAWGGG